MITFIYNISRRTIRRAAKRIAKPARLYFNDWLSRQADAEIARLSDLAQSLDQMVKAEHRQKIKLARRRNDISKG